MIVTNAAPAWFASSLADRRSTVPPLRFMHGKIGQGNGTVQVLKALELLSDDVAEKAQFRSCTCSRAKRAVRSSSGAVSLRIVALGYST